MRAGNDSPRRAEQRVREALALRAHHLPGATSFRVVNSEADFLSGLIVDKYEDVLVMQTSSLGMDQRKKQILDCLTGAEGLERYVATAYGEDTKKDHHLVWVNTYGKGRVFGTALGHDGPAVQTPAFVVTFVEAFLVLAGIRLLWRSAKKGYAKLAGRRGPRQPAMAFLRAARICRSRPRRFRRSASKRPSSRSRPTSRIHNGS